ncbi:hypothetical protein JCM24511_01199 [Saitozyma sp. JCM 24511]|nr:hypothetical protein JCM24511_01199 [Saitozyma sp. JCM 24511]
MDQGQNQDQGRRYMYAGESETSSSSARSRSSAAPTSQAHFKVRLATQDVVQDTTWTDEELGHPQTWFDHLVTHMSTLAGTGKIICAAKPQREPTRDELARISLTFEDHDGSARGGTLNAMADRLAELAGSSVEQIRAEGMAWTRFSIGHKDGLTDFHPLYRSLTVLAVPQRKILNLLVHVVADMGEGDASG